MKVAKRRARSKGQSVRACVFYQWLRLLFFNFRKTKSRNKLRNRQEVLELMRKDRNREEEDRKK